MKKPDIYQSVSICVIISVYAIIRNHYRHSHLPWWGAALTGIVLGVIAVIVGEGIKYWVRTRRRD